MTSFPGHDGKTEHAAGMPYESQTRSCGRFWHLATRVYLKTTKAPVSLPQPPPTALLAVLALLATVVRSNVHRFRSEETIVRVPPFAILLSPGLRSAPIYLSVPNVAGLPFASENGRNARPFSSKTMHGKDYETETWRSSGCRFVLEPPIDLRVRFTEPSNRTKADGKAAAHVPPNSRLCRICRAKKPLFANEL